VAKIATSGTTVVLWQVPDVAILAEFCLVSELQDPVGALFVVHPDLDFPESSVLHCNSVVLLRENVSVGVTANNLVFSTLTLINIFKLKLCIEG
jgi:hypothetical protein